MSADRNEELRQAAREALRELMPGMLEEVLAGAASNGHANGNGHGHVTERTTHAADRTQVVPTTPAPPVAAVLRPSTWTGPALPGEIIGDGSPMPEPTSPGSAPAPAPAPATGSVRSDVAAETRPGVRTEAVTIDSDEDLDAFTRALATRLENPRDRRAIRTGALRFTLRRSSSSSLGRPGAQTDRSVETIHVAKGAVTERTVRDAAQRGARLVLARGAVLTPLARDQARALRVEIEREGRC